MSEYTKGPWEVDFQSYRTHNSPTRFWQTSVTSTMGRVAEAIGATEEEAAAIARLIAAAPELLEALKVLIDVCDGNYRELTDEMQLLIAKAEGKE